MDERPAERKLAAILSADVEGYSRLMGEDELGTVRALTEYREVISAAVARHGGRVVDSPGDNVLADCVSVVDAVQCAVNIQRALQSRNADLPPPRQMRFRIGINLGDVIVQGERLYGDGVNIAARLEGLAAGGDICLSGTAYDQIEGKLPFAFEFSGEQTVKNIARPVRVYRLHLEPRASPKTALGRGGVDRRASIRVAAILAIVMLLGAGGWASCTERQTLEQARALAERAIALDNTLADAYRLLGQVYLWEKAHDRAIAQAERAVVLAPNDADGYETLAEILGWSGRAEESVRLIRRAMRLNPRYPFFYLWTLGHAYYLTDKRQEALDAFGQIVQRNPNFAPAHAYRAVVLSELGRAKEARQAWDEASRLSPSASMSNLRERLPYKRPADLDRLLAAAHRAGMQ